MLRRRGLNVTQMVKQGDPKRVLLGEAEKLEADSIFVGARGLENSRVLVGQRFIRCCCTGEMLC